MGSSAIAVQTYSVLVRSDVPENVGFAVHSDAPNQSLCQTATSLLAAHNARPAVELLAAPADASVAESSGHAAGETAAPG